MPSKAQLARWTKKPKFRTRRHSFCGRCGRSAGNYRKFRVCRICFRELAHLGEVPGVTKASW